MTDFISAKSEAIDKKKKVVIIGSLNDSKNKIMYVDDFFKSLGYDTINPIKINEDYTKNIYYDSNLFCIQKRYIREISEANLVIAVTKSDGTFGESTSYELALAAHFGKETFIMGDVDIFRKLTKISNGIDGRTKNEK